MATKKTTNTTPVVKTQKKQANMTLLELQGILGDRVRITLDDNLSMEERETENEQSLLVCNLAKQMINNGDLILRTEKLAAQTKSLKESMAMKLITW